MTYLSINADSKTRKGMHIWNSWIDALDWCRANCTDVDDCWVLVTDWLPKGVTVPLKYSNGNFHSVPAVEL